MPLFGIFQLTSHTYLEVVGGPGCFKIDQRLEIAFQIWRSVLDLELISESPDCLEPTWKLGVTH